MHKLLLQWYVFVVFVSSLQLFGVDTKSPLVSEKSIGMGSLADQVVPEIIAGIVPVDEQALIINGMRFEYAQEHGETILRAVEDDDVVTVARYIESNEWLIARTFTQEIDSATYSLNAFCLAVIFGSFNVIKYFISKNPDIVNEVVNGFFPIDFLHYVEDVSLRDTIHSYLLEHDAYGYLPHDYMRLKDLMKEAVDFYHQAPRDTVQMEAIYAQLQYCISKNPLVLSYCAITKDTSTKNMILNGCVTQYRVDNILKTAILLDEVWLVKFILACSRKYIQNPAFRSTNQSVSSEFNIIDYISFTKNEAILNVLLKEKPLVSHFLEYCNAWITGNIADKVFNLYDEQTHMPVDDLESPCRKDSFISAFQRDEEDVLRPVYILEEEENSLKDLFLYIKNYDNSFSQTAMIVECIKKFENSKHIDALRETHKYFLTKKGYVHKKIVHTPLSYAIKKNNIDVVQCLIASGASVNQDLVFGSGENATITTLEYAIANKNIEIISCLLEHGALITDVIEEIRLKLSSEMQACLQKYDNQKNIRMIDALKRKASFPSCAVESKRIKRD